MTKKRKHYLDREALLTMLSMGVVFGLLALFHELSLKFFCGGFALGTYIGFAGLPFFDSKKWKPMPWTCAILGMLGGLAFAYFMDRPSTHIGALAICGFIFGYFAPFWARYM